jgi:DNA-binding LytR/AlgR family response regulator
MGIFFIFVLMKNKDIKLLIVDDDVLIIETIKVLLQEIDISNITFSTNKEDMLQKIENSKFDLILLDIRMIGKYDGIEIGQKISKIGIPFLYITAHSDSDMMNRMLDTFPKGFISKPIRKEEFLITIGIAINQIKNENTDTFSVLSNRGYVGINKNEIYFVKSIGNNLEINLLDQKVLIRNTILAFLEEINHEDFVQCHRSYIINSNKIAIKSSSELTLKNNSIIPISRTFLTKFK